MKNIKLFLGACTILLASVTIQAQTLDTSGGNYKTAIGVRGVGTSGLTIKHFGNTNTAWEGIIGFYPNAFSATVLYELYTPAFSTPGLNWYYGIGGHIATQSDVVRREGGVIYRDSNDFGFGVDGIFGIEYKIDQTPIAASFDLKPFVEFVNDGRTYMFLDPGLGLKVTF